MSSVSVEQVVSLTPGVQVLTGVIVTGGSRGVV